MLFELVAAATCMFNVAEAAVRGLSPLTLTRTNMRFKGLASAARTLLAPVFVVGLAELT